jgi:nicotinamide-nucleotide adenylyltransferase
LVIGSSQESRTQKNPFSAKERIEMIKEVLKAEGLLSRTTIIELPDENNHERWVKKVLDIAGRADVTYSGNWLVQKLLKPKYEVHTMKSDVKISATIIRSLITGGKEWKKWVPREVSDYIFKNKLDKVVK